MTTKTTETLMPGQRRVRARVDLGDIVVTREGATNPHREALMGFERAVALADLFDGKPGGYTYWLGPASGGARRIDPSGAGLIAVSRSGDEVEVGVAPGL